MQADGVGEGIVTIGDLTQDEVGCLALERQDDVNGQEEEDAPFFLPQGSLFEGLR